MKKICAVIAALCVMSIALVFSSAEQASAADANHFNAGYIISDARFYDSQAMTTAQIQAFLNKQVPTCHPEWDSAPSTIVCLKDYSGKTTAESQDAYCAGYTGGKTQTAAQIIDGVARSCGVSQQVLLVLLQKENGLVTHSWPSPWRYKTAMGYGCPDTAQCDARYYGFFNQVYNAARQYKMYKIRPYDYNFQIGNNRIDWSPNSSCGSSVVAIKNQATAGLYDYTPYRPNQAALNAGYGTGDSCSSYGNRNFYLYYSDWFGDPTSAIPAPSTPALDTTALPAVSIPNGRYYISSKLNYDFGMDVPAANKKSGTAIQLYQGNRTLAQQYDFRKNGNGSYTITNANSGLVLDVRYAQTANSTPIIQHAANATLAQQWYLRKADDSSYYLQSALGNYVLDVSAAQVADGTALGIYTPNATNAQRVLITSVSSLPESTPVTIASKLNANYVFDIRAASLSSGAALQLYTVNGTPAQQFLLHQVSNGVYEIVNQHSSLNVEIAAGAVADNSILQQYSSNGTQAQRWFLRDAGNGYVSFYNLNSGKYIDVAAGIVAASKQLSIYSGNGTDAQQWKVAIKH
ncbi:MAG: RICIN domain-containing protein [Bifidobacterium sp.]